VIPRVKKKKKEEVGEGEGGRGGDKGVTPGRGQDEI